MNLIKLIILWLSASECLAKIFVPTSNTSELAGLADAAVEIVSSCYRTKSNVVGLVGIPTDGVLETLCSKQQLQVRLLGNNIGDFLDASDYLDFLDDLKTFAYIAPTNFHMFVVTASSWTGLENKLSYVQFVHTEVWNPMATFLIIDWHSSTDQGCSNAYSFLWTAWRKDILNAFYACQHRTKGRLIYSFNPYTNQAPSSWQWENTFSGRDDHPWNLFYQEYHSDEKICMRFQFDKTSDLGGYKIDYVTLENPPTWKIDHSKNGLNSFGGSTGRFYKVIFQALNATPHLVNGKRYGNAPNFEIFLKSVNSQNRDLVLTPGIDYSFGSRTSSKVYRQLELAILTQYSGQESQLNKLLTVLDRSSRFGLLLVIVTTVIFFKCFLGQPIGSAVMNAFRITAYSSLTKVPNNQAARFYLSGVFFLVVTIIGIYQGKLASLLTKPKSKPNVETLQDATDRGYIIFVPMIYGEYLESIEHRIISVYPDCVEYVVSDPSVACLQSKSSLIEAAPKYKLHLSRNSVLQSFSVFIFPKNWPLTERFNSVLTALVESHIIEYITMAEPLEALNRAKFYESEEEKEKFKVIVLSELTFAFVILGIGLGCASVCFIFEIAVSHFCQKRGINAVASEAHVDSNRTSFINRRFYSESRVNPPHQASIDID